MDKESAVHRPGKRKLTTSNTEDKKPNLESNIGIPLENNIESDTGTPNELLNKYQNLNQFELEELCERWMLYDSTGIYIPPTNSKINCQNKKQKNISQPLVESKRKNHNTKFGKGQVGLSSEKFGTNICSCCNSFNKETNFKRENCVHSYMNDNSQPSCSGLQKCKKENDSALDFSTKEIDQIRDLVQCYNVDSALDFLLEGANIKQESTDEIVNISDSHNITGNSDSSQAIINSDISVSFETPTNSDLSVYSINEESINTSSENTINLTSVISEVEPNIMETINNVHPETNTQHTEDNNNSIIESIEIPDSTVGNIEVVDLVNVSFITPRRPLDTTVIEILDDTFNTNLIPSVIDTIDLIDSDSDNESTCFKNKNKVQGRSSLDDNNVSMECPICLESLKGKKIMTTICGHIFCSKCIRNAVKTKRSCPSCRKKLNNYAIHPIYFNF